MSKEDLKIELGSDEMVFWRDIIEARKEDVKNSKNNLEYFSAILEMAEKKYKEAEEAFSKL